MAKNKGNNTVWMVLIVAILTIGLGTLIFLQTQSQSVVTEGDDGEQNINLNQQFDFRGKSPKHDLSFDHKFNGTSLNPTVYVYDEEPDHWGDSRQDPADTWVDKGDASSGTFTVQETVAEDAQSGKKLWIWTELSGYYDEFTTITLPRSADTNINDYNSEPPTTSVGLAEADSLSLSDQDLGISTNGSTNSDHSVVQTITVSQDTEFRLDDLTLQEDGTYVFATDSDADGTYDEGIDKIEVTIDGGESFTPFDTAGSIDDFGGNDEVTFADLDMTFEDQESFNIRYDITCANTSTVKSSGDEKCGDGEDFLDSVILTDAVGSTASNKLTG